MSGMHLVLVGVSALALVVLGGGGVAGIVTGWVAPWGRSRVLRPRLWGYGSLTAAVGGAVWTFVGPLNGPPHGSSAYVAWAGWIVFMVGLLVQFRAQRPGRGTLPPTLPPTTTAS